MKAQNGFSLPVFCIGLAAMALALFQVFSLLGSQNLQKWVQHDAEKAATLFHKNTPKLFIPLPNYLDAHIAFARRIGPVDELKRAYLQKLAWTPSDAHSWSRYAVDLQRFGKIDTPLELAVEQSQKLAPNAKSIALEQSIIAAYNWRVASPRLQKLWENSFTTALRRQQELAYLANTNGVADALCQHLSKPHALEPWCTRLPAYRKACHFGTLSDKQNAWCQSVGLMPRS